MGSRAPFVYASCQLPLEAGRGGGRHGGVPHTSRHWPAATAKSAPTWRRLYGSPSRYRIFVSATARARVRATAGRASRRARFSPSVSNLYCYRAPACAASAAGESSRTTREEQSGSRGAGRRQGGILARVRGPGCSVLVEDGRVRRVVLVHARGPPGRDPPQFTTLHWITRAARLDP